MQQSPTTLAAINAWSTVYYYTNTTTCAHQSTPAPFVYQGQVSVTTPCITQCTTNTNGNGFLQVYQKCTFNPLFAPTYSPVPTQAPTLVTQNTTAIIAGSVVGGLLFLALLCGLWFCCAGGDKKAEEDEYERLRVDRA